MNYSTNKKLTARRDTILNLYKDFTGLQKLPPDKQYWTMCATCIEDGKIKEGSELHQVLEEGFITPGQFHGVDIDESVYRQNIKYPYSNWYCGDFYEVISLAAELPAEGQKSFNPGIVNVDTLHEPVRGINLFCNVVHRLRNFSHVLFIGNFILWNRNREHSPEDIVNSLNKNSKFRYMSTKLCWDENKLVYEYLGASKHNRTKMGTVVLYKP